MLTLETQEEIQEVYEINPGGKYWEVFLWISYHE